MFTLFGRHIGGPPTWRLHTRLYNFARNISTNMSTLEQRTHLKLRDLPSLFTVYNITISWLFPLNGFWFDFIFIAWQLTHSILQDTLIQHLLSCVRDLWNRFQFVLDRTPRHFKANLLDRAKIVMQAISKCSEYRPDNSTNMQRYLYCYFYNREPVCRTGRRARKSLTLSLFHWSVYWLQQLDNEALIKCFDV